MNMDTSSARTDALAFLKINTAGVLASVGSDGKPHASAVFYVGDEGFNIYFLTKLNSRKYKAIQENPAVAFTIGRLDVPQTLQIEGMASELQSDDAKAAHIPDLMKTLTENNPRYIPLVKMDSEAVLMWIEPKWVRWENFALPGVGNENVFTEIPLS